MVTIFNDGATRPAATRLQSSDWQMTNIEYQNCFSANFFCKKVTKNLLLMAAQNLQICQFRGNTNISFHFLQIHVSVRALKWNVLSICFKPNVIKLFFSVKFFQIKIESCNNRVSWKSISLLFTITDDCHNNI